MLNKISSVRALATNEIFDDYAKTNNIGTIVPKFHIYKCKTIEEQMEMNNFDGHYEFNNYPVKMKDIDGIEKELKLCKNWVKTQFDFYTGRLHPSSYAARRLV